MLGSICFNLPTSSNSKYVQYRSFFSISLINTPGIHRYVNLLPPRKELHTRKYTHLHYYDHTHENHNCYKLRYTSYQLWSLDKKLQTISHLILTYLLTPWCRVLLEKLTGLQLVKKFPAFHGTRRFITALTSVRHLSISWANPIQSIYPHPTSWRSVLILSTHLRLCLPSGLFPSGFPTKTP